MKILSYLLVLLLTTAAPAFATVTVTSPASGSTVNSPVQYVATATTSTCAKGVASMGIYVNNKLTYVVNGASLNTSLTLNPGPYNTVVEEWDKCGGASYTPVPITVANQSTQTAVTVTSPVANSYGELSRELCGERNDGHLREGRGFDGHLREQQDCLHGECAAAEHTGEPGAGGRTYGRAGVGLLRWLCFHHNQPDCTGRHDSQHDCDPRVHLVWKLIHPERDCDECEPGDDLRNRRQQLQLAGQWRSASGQPGRDDNIYRDCDRSIGERDGDCDRLSGTGRQHAVHQPRDLHAAGEP